MARFPGFLLLACLSCGAAAEEVGICYNYGCAVKATVVFQERQLSEVGALFKKLADAEEERTAISRAIGLFETFAGMQTPTHNDRGGNVNDDGVEGRMDCIDHAHNTTAYLHLLEARGLLRFHRVLEPVRRAPFIVNDHWAARIQEIKNGQEFIVDSWFFDNGHAAAVFELEDWMHGASPNEQ